MRAVVPIEQSEFEKVFRYDVYTHVLERKWERGGNWRVVDVKPRRDGYCRVRFKGRNIMVHRLIYTLVHGNIDENFQVDHYDGKPENNAISNLQLLSHRDNNAKSRAGINPSFVESRGKYRVQASVEFDGKAHSIHFKNFKDKSEAQLFCDAYNAQFGWNKPFYSVRTKTHEYWRSCMQAFKNQYFNETGAIA